MDEVRSPLSVSALPLRGTHWDYSGVAPNAGLHPEGMGGGSLVCAGGTARWGGSFAASCRAGGSVSSVFWLVGPDRLGPLETPTPMSTPTLPSTETKSPKKPFAVATSLWDGAERKFGSRTLTTFGSRKEAHSAFLLASTTIRNGFKKLTTRAQSKAPDVSKPVQWALTRVEFLNRNGARIEAFHLTKSERGIVSRGGTPFQKKAAKAAAQPAPTVTESPAPVVEVEQVATPSPAVDLSVLSPDVLAALQSQIALLLQK